MNVYMQSPAGHCGALAAHEGGLPDAASAE
jgi:hypothetical protein